MKTLLELLSNPADREALRLICCGSAMIGRVKYFDVDGEEDISPVAESDRIIAKHVIAQITHKDVSFDFVIVEKEKAPLTAAKFHLNCQIDEIAGKKASSEEVKTVIFKIEEFFKRRGIFSRKCN